MAKTCKYTRYKKYVSYDGGATYSGVEEYQIGYLVESASTDCGAPYERWVDGYMCDDCEAKKFVGYLQSGQTMAVDCNSSSELTSGEISNRTSISSATIGSCVTSIGDNAFSVCSSLETISIPPTITSIGNSAFLGCPRMIDVGLPNSVVTIGNNAFSGCTSLSKIILPEGLTSLGESAFERCMNFDTIIIPSTLTSIPRRCFYYARGLSSLEIPVSITSIGDEAFSDCMYMAYIVFYSTTPPTLGNNVFANVSSDFKIFVPEESVDTYKSAWSEYADKIYSI